MKTKVLALTVAAVLAGASFTANAAVEDTWTIGGRLGWARGFIDNGNDYKADQKNALGWGLYGEYSIRSWVGVGIGVTGFNKFKLEEKDGSDNPSLSMYGPEFYARLAYPIDDLGTDVYLRGGFASFYSHNGHLGHDNTSFSPLLGVGFQYQFTKNFGLRLGYDYYWNAYDSDEDSPDFKNNDTDVGLLYLGAQFTFGGPSAAPVKEAKKVRVTESHSLEAGTLFPFDGSTLSAQGKQAISDVVASSRDLSNPEFSVYGYTDRIGSDAYNQNLSEKRANAVANELQADGVTTIKVVEGRGKANPVTGDKCNSVKGRKAVIDCLAPDRRVEVLVSGETTEEQSL